MRTSLADIRQMERYLEGAMGPGEKLAFEARLLLDSGLRKQLKHQKLMVSAVKLYGRKQLRKELYEIDRQLFQPTEKGSFRMIIESIFQ